MPENASSHAEIAADSTMEVGVRTIVEPQGVGDKFPALLLGWKQNGFVALTPPSDLELRDHLYAGKQLIVRFLGSDGQVVGFESKVQGIIYKPQKILFIDFPEALHAVSLRKRNRVDCFLPSTLMVDGEEFGGTVVNISSGGCLFIVKHEEAESAQQIADGSEAFLISRLFAMEEDLHLNCKIMNVSASNSKTSLGIGFSGLELETEELLEQYVDEVSSYLGLSCARAR